MKIKTPLRSRQQRDVELFAMELLTEVVHVGSFSAVARERGIDTSVVSRAIASLEDRIGARLLHRTTRKVSATEAGRALVERLNPAIDEIRQAVRSATDSLTRITGRLRVTASVSFGQRCLVPILPRFAALYPDVTIDLLLTDSVVDLVAEHVDLALRMGSLSDSTAAAKLLLRTHYVVCASPAYLARAGRPMKPADLSGHRCLLFSLPGFRTRWVFCSPGRKRQDVLVSGHVITSNACTLQQCALAGMGVALLPNWLVDTELARGTLVSLFPNYRITGTKFDTGVWFVYPSRKHVPAKVRELMKFIRDSLQQAG